MRNLLALMCAMLITALLAGSYLGWYKVQSTSVADGHRSISLDLNTTKIEQDLAKGVKKIETVIDKELDNTASATTQDSKTSTAPTSVENSPAKPTSPASGHKSKPSKG